MPLTLSDVLPHTTITGLCLDSRQVTPGDVFFAYPGTHHDGRDFMAQAAHARATAIVYDPAGFTGTLPTQCPTVAVPQLQQQISELAHTFYGNPSHDLTVIGITGTNGKTSVSHFLAQALSSCDQPCGVVGTLGTGLLSQLNPTGLTTPDPITCVNALTDCQQQGASYVAMEVSSHALDQSRVAAIRMPIAVFTNLSQDHLEYHGNLANYAAAKAKLWQQPDLRTAIINWDDPVGRDWIQAGIVGADCLAYSNDPHATIPVPAIHLTDKHSVQTPWGDCPLKHSLIGDFNTSNLLAVIAVLGSLGIPLERIEQVLPSITAVPGRMQVIPNNKQLRVIVDFAHTPDALEKALRTLKASTLGRLICVFGCGGNRDTSKRAIMGEIADHLADTVIITNDNPRDESPDAIAQAIAGKTQASILLDRQAAIEHALSLAQAGDTILIAGKGHEQGQISQGKTEPFCDVSVATRWLLDR